MSKENKNYEERLQELITVELLSEVLGGKVISFDIPRYKNEILIQFFGYDDVLNIDTFCFKCKELPYKYGYHIVSKYCSDYNNKIMGTSFLEYERTSKPVKDAPLFIGNTEQEAIIKATLWAKDNI